MSAFVLAILQHPEIQTKAQRQLDEVLGHGELPSFQDVQSLPYITALVKEVLRHNPVTPLGMLQRCTFDFNSLGAFSYPTLTL